MHVTGPDHRVGAHTHGVRPFSSRVALPQGPVLELLGSNPCLPNSLWSPSPPTSLYLLLLLFTDGLGPTQDTALTVPSAWHPWDPDLPLPGQVQMSPLQRGPSQPLNLRCPDLLYLLRDLFFLFFLVLIAIRNCSFLCFLTFPVECKLPENSDRASCSQP